MSRRFDMVLKWINVITDGPETSVNESLNIFESYEIQQLNI